MSLLPDRDCAKCSRLADWRQELRVANPAWFNAPVPSFGTCAARLLIVGLAPGLKGANRTGRPFTGDYAGDLLYGTLAKFGFSQGTYLASADDGLVLQSTRITNAVRCVPPENKPTPSEIAACRDFLKFEIGQLPNLGAILALGQIAHQQVVTALGLKRTKFPFRHGSIEFLPPSEHQPKQILLAASYHCSRYNTNTGRLTSEMFEAVFERLAQHLV